MNLIGHTTVDSQDSSSRWNVAGNPDKIDGATDAAQHGGSSAARTQAGRTRPRNAARTQRQN